MSSLVADPKERKYLSPFSSTGVGLLIGKQGQPCDADGPVTVTMTSDDSQAEIFSGEATHSGVGEYVSLDSSAQTANSGLFSLSWKYAIDGLEQTYITPLEVGQPNSAYDMLPEQMKDLIEMTWIRFADLFDSPGGGPVLQTYFQTHYNRGRLAQLLRIAVGTLNTVAQPYSTFTVDGQGGASFPMAQWGALLERSLYVEVLKHLIRSYVEIPVVQAGDSLTRLDRRDYMQRWQAILAEEEATLKSQLDVFKISQMGLGNAAVLVSGGVFGNYGPMRLNGSFIARPKFWARFY